MTIREILRHDKKFRYQLLSRMQMDCEYVLGNGQMFAGHLWCGNVEEQIEYMKAIHDSFAANEKPEWLTYQQIMIYNSLMFEMERLRTALADELSRLIDAGNSDVEIAGCIGAKRSWNFDDVYYIPFELHATDDMISKIHPSKKHGLQIILRKGRS